jgi:uncharacterized membrane protein
VTGGDRLLLAGVVLAGALGIGISAYLTAVHDSAAPLACSASGAVDCARVVGSAYGVVAGSGLPTSAAGIAWFAASAVFALLRLRRPDSAGAARLQLAWSLTGLAVVVYLVYLEVLRLGALCAWCTAAHALVVVSFVLGALVPVRPRPELSWPARPGRSPPPGPQPPRPGSG